MRREIPIRPYYVNKPFKFLGVLFKTDDVFPPQEMQCSAHRLIALANGRHLIVARVVSDADYEKAVLRVKREFAAYVPEKRKNTRLDEEGRQENMDMEQEDQDNTVQDETTAEQDEMRDYNEYAKARSKRRR